MKSFVFDLLQTTGLGTMFFVMVLCLKRPMQKHCSSKFRHYALLANALLFIVPMYPLKRMLAPLATPLRPWAQTVIKINLGFNSVALSDAPLQVAAFFTNLLAIWLAVSVIFIATKTAKHVSVSLKMKKSSMSAPTSAISVFEEMILGDKSLNKAGRLSRVELLASGDFTSPFVYGFFRKKIILPASAIERYDENEVYLMLRHETLHIVHKDTWKRLLVMVAHALNWFNPLLFYFSKTINESAEMRCDEEVVLVRDNDDARFQYADLLLSMATDRRSRAVAGHHMAYSGFLGHRIKSVTETPRKPNKAVTILFTALLFGVSLIYVMGFTIADHRIVGPNHMDIVDYGEVSGPVVLPVMDDSMSLHVFSEDGAYVYEADIVPDSVNYVPVGFRTDTSRITLTLDSGAKQLPVYIYYTSDLDYPLMQHVLDKAGSSCSFEGLSSQFSYVLGLIADSGHEGAVKITIKE